MHVNPDVQDQHSVLFWGGFFWFGRSIPLFLHGVVQALGQWTGQRDVVVKVGEATDTVVPTKQVHMQKSVWRLQVPKAVFRLKRLTLMICRQKWIWTSTPFWPLGR